MNDKDRQRKEAINRLNMLHDMMGIDKAIVSDFNKGKVPLSVEVFPGFPIGTIHLSDVPDFESKVKKFETEHNCTAYYVVNTCNVFLSILYVSNYTEDWDYERPNPEGYITSVVYDLSGQFMRPDDIDFGECQYINADGSLKRIV